jgi:thymidine kinase
MRIDKLRKSRADSEITQCNVSDCSEAAKRSLSFKKVKDAMPKVKFGNVGKKVHLCKEHYKQYKKATKEQRKMETLTWE